MGWLRPIWINSHWQMVLKDFDKSYDSGKNLLEESRKADNHSSSNTLQRENAENNANAATEASITQAANRTAGSLHLDNVTILSEEDLASLTPKQQRAKGWFDPKTGRIYKCVQPCQRGRCCADRASRSSGSLWLACAIRKRLRHHARPGVPCSRW